MPKGQLHVLVTGGAGYIGSILVPELLAEGHRVTVLDLLLFGTAPLASVANEPGLTIVKGDLRDPDVRARALSLRPDVVIHLAAISNDPSAELDPDVTKSVNGDATEAIMREAKLHGVGRFLYASSASIYGIKDTAEVTEDLPPDPLTLYARYKLQGEEKLTDLVADDFVGVSVRSATVCGDSPRLRLDLTINLLSDHALRLGRIRVFGGSQMRPNVHVRDLTAFYRLLLHADSESVNGQAFNVSLRNATVMDLAEMVADQLGGGIPVDVEPTDDVRSYHLSGRRAKDTLGYAPTFGLERAVVELADRYSGTMRPGAGDDWYRNVRWMNRHPELWRQ